MAKQRSRMRERDWLAVNRPFRLGRSAIHIAVGKVGSLHLKPCRERLCANQGTLYDMQEQSQEGVMIRNCLTEKEEDFHLVDRASKMRLQTPVFRTKLSSC